MTIFNEQSRIDGIVEAEKVFELTKEAYRVLVGEKLLNYMKEDKNLPVLLRDVLEHCKTTSVTFDKHVISGSDNEDREDHCYYIMLNGEKNIAVWSENYSEWYNDSCAEYGENRVRGEDDFLDTADDEDLIGRDVTDEDSGEDAYTYLLSLMENIRQEDMSAFYAHLVKVES